MVILWNSVDLKCFKSVVVIAVYSLFFSYFPVLSFSTYPLQMHASVSATHVWGLISMQSFCEQNVSLKIWCLFTQNIMYLKWTKERKKHPNIAHQKRIFFWKILNLVVRRILIRRELIQFKGRPDPKTKRGLSECEDGRMRIELVS